jgi:hypothetical protein
LLTLNVMVTFFMVGPRSVRCELHPLGPSGPFRLAVHDPNGVVEEYFDCANDALLRQEELEARLYVEWRQREGRTPLAVSHRLGHA